MAKSIYPSEREVLEELRQKIALQTNVIDAIDRKLATILGATGTIVSIVGAGLSIAKLQPKAIWLLSPAILFLLLGFLFSILAFWPRGWYFNPSPEVLLEDYLKRKPETPTVNSTTGSVAQIAADIRSAFEKNRKEVYLKSRLLKWSLVFEGLGLGLAVILLVIIASTGGFHA